MSLNITTAQVTQFQTNVAMLLQQMDSRLASAVEVRQLYGKSAEILEQFGSVSPVRNASRHSDTPLISVPQDRRWAFPTDYDWADLIDTQDKLRLLIDPTGSYTRAGVAAMNRAKDDAIISGFFNSNMTGENGSSATGLLSAYGGGSQLVAATVGSGNTNSGLNVAKLRAAKKILMAAEVDLDNEPIYMAISATQHDNLLNEIQIASKEYNSTAVLENGMVKRFMGFEFIHSERIPGAANFDVANNPSVTGYTTGTTWLIPFWAKSGVALGVWNDITASVDKRPDKRNAMQVYLTATLGATRLEEKRCGIITCY